MPKAKILRGRRNICEYLDNMSRTTFYKWMNLGLPVYKGDGMEWVSHSDALDEFFYLTSVNKSVKT